MSAVVAEKEEVVTNYYDGKRYFLVRINGSEVYVSEEKYGKMNLVANSLPKNVING